MAEASHTSLRPGGDDPEIQTKAAGRASLRLARKVFQQLRLRATKQGSHKNDPTKSIPAAEAGPRWLGSY